PSMSPTLSWQARAAFPSTRTVHAPQEPSPQPYLAPVRPNSSRSRCSRVRSGAEGISRSLPLTRSLAHIAQVWRIDLRVPRLALVAALRRLCCGWRLVVRRLLDFLPAGLGADPDSHDQHPEEEQEDSWRQQTARQAKGQRQCRDRWHGRGWRRRYRD